MVMHKILQQLQEDHRRLLLLLDYLEKEISSYEPYNDELPDLAMILDILDYMQTYPEKWHHPLEEEIFNVLLQKPIKKQDLLKTISMQHYELEFRTMKLVKQFNIIANNQVMPITQVMQDAKEYLQYQREHIDIEDRHIFPLITKYIEDDELNLIVQRMTLSDDPLFGACVRKSYQLLYEEVVKMEEEGVMDSDDLNMDNSI